MDQSRGSTEDEIDYNSTWKCTSDLEKMLSGRKRCNKKCKFARSDLRTNEGRKLMAVKLWNYFSAEIKKVKYPSLPSLSIG